MNKILGISALLLIFAIGLGSVVYAQTDNDISQLISDILDSGFSVITFAQADDDNVLQVWKNYVEEYKGY